jgi:hypothetical protein
LLNVHLDRHKASKLLKELIEHNLTEASFISLRENKHGKFDLIIKGKVDSQNLEQFIAEQNLVLNLDKEKGDCIISKP